MVSSSRILVAVFVSASVAADDIDCDSGRILLQKSTQWVKSYSLAGDILKSAINVDSVSLPGSLDSHGPDALGKQSQLSLFMKFALVSAVMALAASPAVISSYLVFGAPEKNEYALSAMSRCGRVVFRVGMFVVYFWFGILKIAGVSPAEPLVQITFREMPFSELTTAAFFCKWIVGPTECFIGTLFMLTLLPSPRLKFASTIAAMCFGLGHMITVTILPIFLLPHEVWQEGYFPVALTFEGQYIVKNMICMAAIMLMASDLACPAH